MNGFGSPGRIALGYGQIGYRARCGARFSSDQGMRSRRESVAGVVIDTGVPVAPAR